MVNGAAGLMTRQRHFGCLAGRDLLRRGDQPGDMGIERRRSGIGHFARHPCGEFRRLGRCCQPRFPGRRAPHHRAHRTARQAAQYVGRNVEGRRGPAERGAGPSDFGRTERRAMRLAAACLGRVRRSRWWCDRRSATAADRQQLRQARLRQRHGHGRHRRRHASPKRQSALPCPPMSKARSHHRSKYGCRPTAPSVARA